MPPAQPPGYYDTTGKLHGTVKTVPYKPTGNAEPSRDCAATKIHRAVGAGQYTARGQMMAQKSRVGLLHLPDISPLIRRGGQPHKKYDVTCNLHERALLAPTAQGILALYGLTLQPHKSKLREPCSTRSFFDVNFSIRLFGLCGRYLLLVKFH